MAMKLRKLKPKDLNDISTAWALIAQGRDLLRRAGARKSANSAARTLKSVEGAIRHAQRIEGESL